MAKDSPDRIVGYGQVKFRGHGPEWWYNRAARRYDQMTQLRQKFGDAVRSYKRVRHVTLTRPDALTAIRMASIVYRVDYSMLVRKASCESGGTFSQYSYNPSGASGLFQFLPSTWASTPFGREDVFNGYINALAAGWMHAQGRGGEWVCQ
jgi:hypothetical protein